MIGQSKFPACQSCFERLTQTARAVRSGWGIVAIVCTLILPGAPAWAAKIPTVDFARDVQPILNEHCAKCHGGVKKESGLSVLSRDLLLSEPDGGEPVIEPGDADESVLIDRIISDDPDERMPPDGKPLSKEDIETLRVWIDAGAPWPSHWSYGAVPKIEPPKDVEGDHPIDRFVRRRLAQSNIQPSPEARPDKLLRRLYLDLTGLLPSIEDQKAFSTDHTLEAIEHQIDQLLASPHFGERWARHWLDEARYADSEGYEKDSFKTDAYRYRDWVVNAVNHDMPFDQFTIKQIAGDLLPDRTEADLIATKFHLQSQFNLEGGVDAEEDRTKRILDRVSTVATVWLGASIGCCQCHDHPYDPLTQHDFYSMVGLFNNADMDASLLGKLPEDAEKFRIEREKLVAKVAKLVERQVDDKNLNTLTQNALVSMHKFDHTHGFTRYLSERTKNRRKTYILQRGDFLRPDFEEGALTPGTPAILPSMAARSAVPDRIDLARWLVADNQPLTARVTVNKIWMHLLGRPLASQANEFGSRGATPTHPELLDWLAYWFVHEGKWSRKALIRLIVTSDTYRQSSTVRLELNDIDPSNDLLARQNRFRVEAEIIRDIALQASGLLSLKMGGPSVYPPLPAIIAKQTYAGGFKYRGSKGEDRYRRGLYTAFRRTAIDPNLATFDCPDASMTRQQRDRSNNPLQVLAMLQDEVFHEASQTFAQRLLGAEVEPQDADRDRLRLAFLLAINRPAEDRELKPLQDLLKVSREYYREHPEEAMKLIGNHSAQGVSGEENAAWISTVRVVLNLDEFVTRE